MATRRAPTRTWTARNAELYLGRYPDAKFTSTETLSGIFVSTGVDFSAPVKTVTITPPETAWEKQDFLGKDSSNFQNQLLDEKPVGIATITATLIVGEDETIEDYIVSGTSATAPAGFTRRQIGSDNSSVNRVTAVVTLSSSTDAEVVAFGMEDARVVKWGDVRISGPDSHFEQDVTFVCLAKNFYSEFKD